MKARHECEIINKGATFKVLWKKEEENADEDRLKGWLTKPGVTVRNVLANSRHSRWYLGNLVGTNCPIYPRHMIFSIKTWLS